MPFYILFAVMLILRLLGSCYYLEILQQQKIMLYYSIIQQVA